MPTSTVESSGSSSPQATNQNVVEVAVPDSDAVIEVPVLADFNAVTFSDLLENLVSQQMIPADDPSRPYILVASGKRVAPNVTLGAIAPVDGSRLSVAIERDSHGAAEN